MLLGFTLYKVVRRFTYIACWVACCLAGPNHANASQALEEVLAAVKGQRLQLVSKTLGVPISVDVVLPAGYHQNNQQRFPVIFLLDSQWRLMSFMHSYGVLAYEKAVPESIIIGLNADSLTGPWAGDIDGFRRTFYGVPSNPPIKASDTDINRLQLGGRADELLAFFQHELIPYIDKNYRTQPDKTLVGTSLSGLFGAYALLKSPPLFQRFILSSPSVYWADNTIFREITLSEKAKPAPPVRLFIGVGDEELADTVHAFSKQLKEALHPNAKVEFHQSTLGHVSSDIEVMVRGLEYVFDQ